MSKSNRRARRPAADATPRKTAQETVKLWIDTLASGGEGVGRDSEGRVMFVPHTAPGDHVEVSVYEKKKSWARGTLANIIEPAESRTEPDCSLFAEQRCGGCQWQHLSYETQSGAKQHDCLGTRQDHLGAGT